MRRALLPLLVLAGCSTRLWSTAPPDAAARAVDAASVTGPADAPLPDAPLPDGPAPDALAADAADAPLPDAPPLDGAPDTLAADASADAPPPPTGCDAGAALPDDGGPSCNALRARFLAELACVSVACSVPADCAIAGAPIAPGCACSATIGGCGRPVGRSAYLASPLPALEEAFRLSCDGPVGAICDCGLPRLGCVRGRCAVVEQGCFCGALGDPCGGPTPCCTGTCTQGFCCGPAGSACAAPTDCCAGLACGADGTCS